MQLVGNPGLYAAFVRVQAASAAGVAAASMHHELSYLSRVHTALGGQSSAELVH